MIWTATGYQPSRQHAANAQPRHDAFGETPYAVRHGDLISLMGDLERLGTICDHRLSSFTSYPAPATLDTYHAVHCPGSSAIRDTEPTTAGAMQSILARAAIRIARDRQIAMKKAAGVRELGDARRASPFNYDLSLPFGLEWFREHSPFP